MSPQEELEHWQRIAGQGVQTEHELRIEIERLRTEVEKFRQDVARYGAEIGRLREQVHDANGVADLAMKHRDIAEQRNTDTAAFLDVLAERLEAWDYAHHAAGCRAMAAKLRGKA